MSVNDQKMLDRNPPRHAVVAQSMTPEDVAQLLPASALEAGERAFDEGYWDDADELNAALLAATPILRLAEVDDLIAEIKRRRDMVKPHLLPGLDEVLGLLSGRRSQLEALRR